MRKYTKPVMEMEKIEMNQAIAACSKGQGDFEDVFKGYWCSSCRQENYYYSDLPQTEDGARAADQFGHFNEGGGGQITHIYEVFKNGEHFSFYEDLFPYNGVTEHGAPESPDNWQTVKNWNEIVGHFHS